MGRSAAGLSQQELADMIGISKVTLARVETLESKLKAGLWKRSDFQGRRSRDGYVLGGGIGINISPKALQLALSKLQDESQRRADESRLKVESVK